MVVSVVSALPRFFTISPRRGEQPSAFVVGVVDGGEQQRVGTGGRGRSASWQQPGPFQRGDQVGARMWPSVGASSRPGAGVEFQPLHRVVRGQPQFPGRAGRGGAGRRRYRACTWSKPLVMEEAPAVVGVVGLGFQGSVVVGDWIRCRRFSLCIDDQ